MMRKTRILYINPLGDAGFDAHYEAYLRESRNEDTEVNVISLTKGPHHVEYHYYETLIAVEMLHAIKQAEKDGYDAAVIGCFYDPFLREAREICDRMVVTAPAESSLQLASILGNSFSIIVGRKKWIPVMHENVLKYGYGQKLASFRALDLGVLEFHANEARTQKRLETEARKAKEEDSAEVLVLGCCAQFGFYKTLQERLGLPVIDVMLAPFKHAEFLVEMRDRFGWITSKVGGYETPPIHEIKQWRLEEQYGVPGLWDIPDK